MCVRNQKKQIGQDRPIFLMTSLLLARVMHSPGTAMSKKQFHYNIENLDASGNCLDDSG